jgi:HAE1 family hydrophobic/amphiphilic exporter-1
MNLAKFSVTRPVAVTMRIAALVLLGAICYLRLSVDLLPKVSIPTVVVNVNWPNVGPEEMETQITRPLEQAVSSAPNITQVSSTSSTGQSSVRVQFNWGTDIGKAAVDVLQLVQRAKGSFPNDRTLQEPRVFKFDPSTLPIMIYGVTGDTNMVRLRTTLQNDIVPVLESADGVAQVNVTGGQARAILVDADPVKLQAYGITLDDLQNRLRAENLNLPAGIARQGNTEYTIRSVGYFGSLDEIRRVPIKQVNGALVTLGMVAAVKDEHPETRIVTRFNGEPAVGITIVKQSDANTVDTSRAVEEKVKLLRERFPNLKFNEGYQQAGFIEESIHHLQREALIGGTLAVLVLLFFLRNVRSTLVVALSIPISIISAFALLYFAGFTLNTITLSALALSTGLIVDDAVVVMENIFRHIERDRKRAMEASITGTQEILSAVIASTLTIVVVFMPLFLIQGQAGQTYSQFGLVVIFAILVSLLDATTVVPMLASRLIKEDEVHEENDPALRAARGKRTTLLMRAFDWAGTRFTNMESAYRRGLTWSLRRRWWVLGGAIGITLASLPLIPLIGSETLPQTDSGDLNVNVRLPIGTAYTVTDGVMQEVERRILKNPNVKVVFAAAGTNFSVRGAGGGAGYQGGATVRLKEDRRQSTAEVVKALQRDLSSIPGTRINVTAYDMVTQVLTGGNTNMEVDIFGQDIKLVQAKAREVMEAMRNVPGLEGVDLGVQDATPELRWKVDREKAAALGISFSDIAGALNSATNGVLSTYYQEGGYQYPIYVQVPASQRKTINQLSELPITPSAGPNGNRQPVLLGQVATPVMALGPNEITRLDRQRYIAVNGRISNRTDSEVQADVRAALSKIEFTDGIYWDFGTQQKQKAKEFSGLGVAVLLAIALIYMLLASQFESFTSPLVILASVPLCIVGVIVALFLTDRAFGLTAFVGLLLLIGIVVKNGILLVDYTTQLRGRGMNRDEAILTASPTRLRPILMTSCAAVLGMVPLAMAIGRGSETQAPLATAVIGGLLTSTILTLFVVPVLYTMIDDAARRLRGNPRDLAPSTVLGSESTPGVAEIGEAPLEKIA